MNKLKLVCLGSLLISGMANAALHCNGFKVIVRNDLPQDLEVKAITLSNAILQPSFLPLIQANTEQAFTVNNTGDSQMEGEFVLQTKASDGEPKEVHIKYTLDNKALHCSHKDETPDGLYAIDKDRSTGEVKYTIKHK